MPTAVTARPAADVRDRFNRALFAWHATNRRPLLIREAGSPWAILVAEVMSQQTQVERIGPAWSRFVERWPAPADLAAASTREVLLAWAGLGYNRRALALREAARMIVESHAGFVPTTVEALEALPGIGPYTARAIAAAAFKRPVAPLDVNVRRVVGRVAGREATASALQDAADVLVSRRDPRRWVDAVMDLAATVCLPRTPACVACPVRGVCASRDQVTLVSPVRRAAQPPFRSTARWLRGRLLAAARDAPVGSWIDVPARLGEHGPDAVGAALAALETEGFLEVDAGRARLRSGPSEAPVAGGAVVG